jgi:hypothetical protein
MRIQLPPSQPTRDSTASPERFHRQIALKLSLRVSLVIAWEQPDAAMTIFVAIHLH